MSRALYTERTSRRVRGCDVCRGRIEVGERYRRAALPPHCDPNEGPHWRTIAVCADCWGTIAVCADCWR